MGTFILTPGHEDVVAIRDDRPRTVQSAVLGHAIDERDGRSLGEGGGERQGSKGPHSQREAAQHRRRLIKTGQQAGWLCVCLSVCVVVGERGVSDQRVDDGLGAGSLFECMRLPLPARPSPLSGQDRRRRGCHLVSIARGASKYPPRLRGLGRQRPCSEALAVASNGNLRSDRGPRGRGQEGGECPNRLDRPSLAHPQPPTVKPLPKPSHHLSPMGPTAINAPRPCTAKLLRPQNRNPSLGGSARVSTSKTSTGKNHKPKQSKNSLDAHPPHYPLGAWFLFNRHGGARRSPPVGLTHK